MHTTWKRYLSIALGNDLLSESYVSQHEDLNLGESDNNLIRLLARTRAQRCEHA